MCQQQTVIVIDPMIVIAGSTRAWTFLTTTPMLQQTCTRSWATCDPKGQIPRAAQSFSSCKIC